MPPHLDQFIMRNSSTSLISNWTLFSYGSRRNASSWLKTQYCDANSHQSTVHGQHSAEFQRIKQSQSQVPTPIGVHCCPLLGRGCGSLYTALLDPVDRLIQYILTSLCCEAKWKTLCGSGSQETSTTHRWVQPLRRWSIPPLPPPNPLFLLLPSFSSPPASTSLPFRLFLFNAPPLFSPLILAVWLSAIMWSSGDWQCSIASTAEPHHGTTERESRTCSVSIHLTLTHSFLPPIASSSSSSSCSSYSYSISIQNWATPLWYAADAGHLLVVEWLLNNIQGLDINSMSRVSSIPVNRF